MLETRSVAVAAGVGLIKSGFDTDPPLDSLEQAEIALRVPIVGVIPAADGASDRAADEPCRFSSGLAKIIGHSLKSRLEVMMLGARS